MYKTKKRKCVWVFLAVSVLTLGGLQFVNIPKWKVAPVVQVSKPAVYKKESIIDENARAGIQTNRITTSHSYRDSHDSLPTVEPIWKKQISELVKAGKLLVAKNLLDTKLNADPQNIEVLNEMGYFYSRALADPKTGTQFFKQVVQRDPNHGQALYEIVHLALENPTLEQPKEFLENLINKNPDAWIARLSLGDYLVKSGRADVGIPLLEHETTHAADPSLVRPWLAGAYFAIRNYEQAAKLFSEDKSHRLDEANCYIALGDNFRAEPLITEVLSEDPKNEFALYLKKQIVR